MKILIKPYVNNLETLFRTYVVLCFRHFDQLNTRTILILAVGWLVGWLS